MMGAFKDLVYVALLFSSAYYAVRTMLLALSLLKEDIFNEVRGRSIWDGDNARVLVKMALSKKWGHISDPAILERLVKYRYFLLRSWVLIACVFLFTFVFYLSV
jgi:hypothetical protein